MRAALLLGLAALCAGALSASYALQHSRPDPQAAGPEAPAVATEAVPAAERVGAREGRQGPAAPAAAGVGKAPFARCAERGGAPSDGPLYVVDAGSRVALAVNGSGRFALYGGADPETGTRTEDSYDLLVDCLPQLSDANLAKVLVEGDQPEPAGAGNLRSRPVLTDSGRTVLASYSFGRITLDQRLSLMPGGTLRIVYALRNDSRKATTVSVRSLLTPPAAAGRGGEGGTPRFLVPSGEGGGEAVVYERTLLDGRAGGAVISPREGVPSDSTARWQPAGGRLPDAVTMAGTLELLSAPFRYRVRLAWPLPPSSSIAAYWLGERLPPGSSVTLEARYVPAVSANGASEL